KEERAEKSINPLFVQRRLSAGSLTIDTVAIDHAQLATAADVPEAADGVQCAFAGVVVRPAAQQAPLRGDGPDHREVMLADLVVVLDVVVLPRNPIVRVVDIQAADRSVAQGVDSVDEAEASDLLRGLRRLFEAVVF